MNRVKTGSGFSIFSYNGLGICFSSWRVRESMSPLTDPTCGIIDMCGIVLIMRCAPLEFDLVIVEIIRQVESGDTVGKSNKLVVLTMYLRHMIVLGAKVQCTYPVINFVRC